MNIDRTYINILSRNPARLIYGYYRQREEELRGSFCKLVFHSSCKPFMFNLHLYDVLSSVGLFVTVDNCVVFRA